MPTAAADTIDGRDGDDTIDGGGGGDTIAGGGGEDTISHPGSVSVIHGDADNDTITITAPANAAVALGGSVYGDAGNDSLHIDVFEEPVQDVRGTLFLYGGAGNDEISPSGWDWMDFSDLTTHSFGGEGNDALSAVTLFTGSAAWPYAAGNNDDFLDGGPGDDRYFVLEERDVISEASGEGYDRVEVWDTDYTIPDNVEDLTANYLASWNLSYTYYGNTLNNVINDANGGDFIYGLGGNDTIYGASANDYIDGGTGSDRLYGDEDDDKVFGADGNDTMYGGAGIDELGGQAGNDKMYGDAGNDKLGGGTGNDLLDGGSEVDTLAGRDGLDQLWGRAGNDVFDYEYVIDSKPGASLRDVINDFVGVGAAAGDRIDLNTIDANTAAGGNQNFAFKGTAAFSAPGQVRVAASGSDTLVQANVTGNSGAELEILVKDGAALHSQWVAGDFIL